MKIELARHSGFCMGVRDAIVRIVTELNTADDEICVYGPLIHNQQTIDILQKRGLRTIDSLDDIDDRAIVIRTHGIPIASLRDIKSRSSRCINLTCPRVSKVQGIIKKYSAAGHYTIIIGDRDHAEVLGLKSYAAAGVTVVSDEGAIDRIPHAEKYIVVSQTTQDLDQFNRLIGIISARLKNLTIFNTICDSTHNRQNDIQCGIKRGIDTLVVVGGKHSANTMRLAQMGHEAGITTFHVETEAELSEGNFATSNYVLVTAGASTPAWIINNVMEKLYRIKQKRRGMFVNIVTRCMEFLLQTNILSSVAAFFITLFALKFIGMAPDFRMAAVSLLYIFAMYTINNYFEIEFLFTRSPVKYAIQRKYKHILTPLAVIALLVSMLLVASSGLLVFSVYLVSVLLGSLYSTHFVKNLVHSLKIRLFQKMYNLKNVVSSFGWVIITTLIPVLYYGAKFSSAIALGIFVFSMILLRDIVLDIIAFQGDLIFGRQSLPTMLGMRKTGRLYYSIILTVTVIFALLSIFEGRYRFLIFLLVLFYFGFVYTVIVHKNYYVALKYEMLADMNFLLFIALYFAV